MSEPLSGSGTAAALGGATVFGLFTGMDFGIVFGAFAGGVVVATNATVTFSLARGGTFSGVVYCRRAGCACAVSLDCIKNRV